MGFSSWHWLTDPVGHGLIPFRARGMRVVEPTTEPRPGVRPHLWTALRLVVMLTPVLLFAWMLRQRAHAPSALPSHAVTAAQSTGAAAVILTPGVSTVASRPSRFPLVPGAPASVAGLVSGRQTLMMRPLGDTNVFEASCGASYACRFSVLSRTETGPSGVRLWVQEFEDADGVHAFAVIAPVGTSLAVVVARGVTCAPSTVGSHVLECDQTDADAEITFTVS
jgi:hypothetical protein